MTRLFCLLFALCACTPGCAAERDPALAGFFSAPLAIATSDERHEFVVYLAVTDRQRARGLMHVRHLPHNYGMLFLYDRPRPLGMWMKNTFIPLDMLFIRADGTIESIVADTVPQSLQSIRSRGNVLAVLELNAGTARRLGIEAGDRVLHRAFESQPD